MVKSRMILEDPDMVGLPCQRSVWYCVHVIGKLLNPRDEIDGNHLEGDLRDYIHLKKHKEAWIDELDTPSTSQLQV